MMAANRTTSFDSCGSSSCDVHVFAEFKKTMSIINCTLFCKSFLEGNSTDGEVNVDHKKITIHYGDRVHSCQFSNTELFPLTCRGLKFSPEGEIQFTMQVERVEESSNGDGADEVYKKQPSKQTELVDKISLFQNKCFCSSCGQKLLSSHSMFSRVLPLPSENWSDFSDMWFCHKHEGDEDNDKNSHHQKHPTSLLPKTHDCLVAESYFVIWSNHLKQGITRRVSSYVQCERCGNLLGERYSKSDENGVNKTCDLDVFKIFRHSVLFYNPEMEEDKSFNTKNILRETEDYFAKLILEQSRLYTSFKLMVVSEMAAKEIKCLIWLLDPDLSLFQGSFSSQDFVVQPVQALKVLYNVVLREKNSPHRNDDIVKQWEKDDTVHQIQLPYNMCLQLVSLLVTSSRCVPKSQRYLNKFYAGFLRYLDR